MGKIRTLVPADWIFEEYGYWFFCSPLIQTFKFFQTGIMDYLYIGLGVFAVAIVMYYRYLRFFRSYSMELIHWFARRDKSL